MGLRHHWGTGLARRAKRQARGHYSFVETFDAMVIMVSKTGCRTVSVCKATSFMPNSRRRAAAVRLLLLLLLLPEEALSMARLDSLPSVLLKSFRTAHQHHQIPRSISRTRLKYDHKRPR